MATVFTKPASRWLQILWECIFEVFKLYVYHSYFVTCRSIFMNFISYLILCYFIDYGYTDGNNFVKVHCILLDL